MAVAPEPGLAQWLLEAAQRHNTLPELHGAFCDHLAESGLPISRSSLGLEVLHPELSGRQFVWASSEVKILDSQRSVGTTTDYLSSPVRVVDETWAPYRRRLDTVVRDMPLLQDLRSRGATDYVIFPLPFLDRNRTAFLSFTTQEEHGFADAEITALGHAANLLGPWAERHVLKRIAIDLLDIYVGRRSGERVYRGAIDRGAVEYIRSAILMTDMRGFTRYSDSHELSRVVRLLNRYFETMVDAIEAQGGEVLKFMGDALLAIFPEQAGDLLQPCRAAVRAARAAEASLAEREPKVTFGLALHAGDIAYGNIGGRTRLDFTVIGPAVNHTSRLLELSKALERTIVVSEAFTAASGLTLPGIGEHSLRDVPERQVVFTLPSPA